MNDGFVLSVEMERAEGFVAVDSVVRGTSSGGVRVAEDLNREEICLLAREMTLKYSFCGLERGGAKSGVRVPAGIGAQEKRAILAEFGRRIAPVIHKGLYYPGMDMNCGPDDLRALYRGAGQALGEITDTSFFTALSAEQAVLACGKRAGVRPGHPLTVAVEGFGSVAGHLAARLPEDSYRIVAVSTLCGGVYNPDGFGHAQLARLRADKADCLADGLEGERLEPREKLLTLPVDILIPSARVQSLNDANAEEVQARYVVPVANAPYAGQALAVLGGRGVFCLPGFVCNAGGVFASSLFDLGVGVERVVSLTAALYRPAVDALLERAEETGATPVDIAADVARKRYAGRENGPQPLARRLCERLRRAGAWPKFLSARQAEERFARSMRSLEEEIGMWRPEAKA